MQEQVSKERLVAVACKFLVEFSMRTGHEPSDIKSICDERCTDRFLDNVSWLMKAVRLAAGLLSDLERGYLWFTRPNSNELFGGATPIEYLRGSDPARFKTLYLFLLSHHEFTV